LAENREAARIRTLFHAELREQELLCQIEELQIDVHCLNNRIDPIPHLAPAYPTMMGEGPQKIVAEDVGMEVEAAAVPEEEEDEEVEPFKDDQGDGVSDVESDLDA
jgi:hypothetical protein